MPPQSEALRQSPTSLLTEYYLARIGITRNERKIKMKKLAGILDELEVSKWSAFWTLLTGGWADLAKLLCTAFTKLLRKCDPDKLKKYSSLAAKIAVCAKSIVDVFVDSAKEKAAAEATIVCIQTLAEHLEDGEYTTDELESDIKNIASAVDAWKAVADEEEDCPSCQD